MKNGQYRANWKHRQDEEKQNINTSQYVLETTIRKQTHIK